MWRITLALGSLALVLAVGFLAWSIMRPQSGPSALTVQNGQAQPPSSAQTAEQPSGMFPRQAAVPPATSPEPQPATYQPRVTAASSVPMPSAQPAPIAAPAAPVKQPQSGAHKYQVQPGDTLWSISRRHYGSGKFASAIASHNGLNDATQIKAGSTLLLPAFNLEEGPEKPSAQPKPGPVLPASRFVMPPTLSITAKQDGAE
jgi:LysM repeat protein